MHVPRGHWSKELRMSARTVLILKDEVTRLGLDRCVFPMDLAGLIMGPDLAH